MPIPGSNLDLLFDMDAASELMADVHFPSKATVRKMTVVTALSGQETHTFADMTGDYADVPCRKAPLIIIRSQNQELGTNDFPEGTSAKYTCLMLGEFPNMKLTDQLKIDGVIYEIKSIDVDGNQLVTRVMLGMEIPFNA